MQGASCLAIAVMMIMMIMTVSYDFLIDSLEDRSTYHDATDWFAKYSKFAFST